MNEEQKAALAKLREPFDAHQISKLCRPYKKDSPKGKCQVCGGWHALTDRLLKVDPAWNWEPVAWTDAGQPCIDRDGGMWIKLTVCGVTRYGYGDAQEKTGPNATKERIGDALRNAAMRFGCALDLWHKGGDLYDGWESAGGHQEQQPTTKTAPDATITQAQVNHLLALMAEVGADGPKFLHYCGVTRLADLPAAGFERAIQALEAKRKPS